MNKKLKIVSLIIIFLLIGTLAVQAATVTKESIKKNLESYSLTGKVASAVVGNSKYTIGGEAARISSVAVTDDTISFLSSNTPLIYKYKVEGNVCTFTAETDITAQTTTNEYLTETLKINLLSACFLAVTDSENVDSNNALFYYIDRADKTKLNVSYDGIANDNYVAIAKRYVETVGRVDDTVFNLYTRTLSNTETNCKYETVLEIRLDQISKISVDRPATNSSPTTQPDTTTPPPATTEPEEPVSIPAYTGEVITVKPGDTKKEETEVPDKWKSTVATIVNGVPVPKGFEIATYYGINENTGFVIRQISSKESENFHRLCYVWVPVNKNGSTIESLEDAKRALNEVYTRAGLNTKTSESATESLPNELVKSVKEYGGFYIAIGELGYDNNGKFYNRPRGMKESDTNTGWYGVDYGNYFRYVPESYWNQTSPVNYVAAAATYDNIMKDCTLDKINKVCEMLSTESVTSHLTYGAEWDAAMLWILKQDSNTPEDLVSLLLKDSSSIGKYKGTMFNAKMLNCTWGFAGNLSEVTQEKVDGKIVVRGGSYATLGSEQPIASRTAIEESEVRTGNQYGFRNCIYINLTEGALEPESELQALIDSGKATTDRITTVADKDGKKIAIPQGFKVTKDAYAIKDGVVIENAQGDQFVWIPVVDFNEMYNANEQSGKLYNITKNGSNLKVITSINDKYFEPGIVTGGTGRDVDAKAENLKIVELDSASKLERQIRNEFNAMINSVKTHGGFYIARYETGNIDQEYPSVKAGAQNRNNLNWYEAYMKNQKIPTGNYGISGTIYGCQWDMALRWLQSCDRTNQKVNHIEDLANGTAEWTMEAFANDARIVRDVTREESTVVQAGTRMDYSPTDKKAEIGTRAMMYIR